MWTAFLLLQDFVLYFPQNSEQSQKNLEEVN